MTPENAHDLDGSIPPWLWDVPMEHVIRIDAGLEGRWTETVTPVWSEVAGFVGFGRAVTSHPRYRPALELALADGWIGVPCFRVCGGRNVLDQAKARLLIARVELRRGG